MRTLATQKPAKKTDLQAQTAKTEFDDTMHGIVLSQNLRAPPVLHVNISNNTVTAPGDSALVTRLLYTQAAWASFEQWLEPPMAIWPGIMAKPNHEIWPGQV